MGAGEGRGPARDRTAELRRAAGARAGAGAGAGAAGAGGPGARAGAPEGQLAAALRAAQGLVGQYRGLRGAGRAQERAKLEGAVAEALRGVSERIDDLRRLGDARGGPAGGQARAHHMGVALILSESLQALAGEFEAARAAVRAREPQRSLPAPRQHRRNGGPPPGPGGGGKPAPRPLEGLEGLPQGGQQREALQQQLQLEGDQLAEDLQGLSAEVQGVGTRLEQVAELNRAMAVNVSQQVEQLERLYGESVAQAENFRRGNVQLKKAVERSAGSSNYLVVFILVAAFALLFLDRMT